MITAMLTDDDGDRLLVLGLTGENVRRLKAGQPIHFSLERVNIPDMEVLIAYGEEEGELIDLLNPFTTASTKKSYEGPGDPPEAYDTMKGTER